MIILWLIVLLCWLARKLNTISIRVQTSASFDARNCRLFYNMLGGGNTNDLLQYIRFAFVTVVVLKGLKWLMPHLQHAKQFRNDYPLSTKTNYIVLTSFFKMHYPKSSLCFNIKNILIQCWLNFESLPAYCCCPLLCGRVSGTAFYVSQWEATGNSFNQ